MPPKQEVLTSTDSVVLERSGTDSGIVTIGSKKYTVKIAETPSDRARGLSGREKLNADEGMLFIFPEDGIYPFWMKDMRFAIDIIWIDASWNVVAITKNARPESFPALFTTPSKIRYVLEIASS